MVAHIYRYIRGNLDLKLLFKSGNNCTLEGYVDAAYANQSDCRSTSGFIFTLGGTPISWLSKRQSVVALSTAEAEYIAATESAKDGIWLKNLLKDLECKQNTVILHEDNQACIALSKNPQFHSRTKHIQVDYHYIRDQVENGEFILKYIPTKSQLADLTTKGLAGHQIRPALAKLNLIDFRVTRGLSISLISP